MAVDPESRFTFREANKSFGELEALLRDGGILIDRQSVLEDIVLATFGLEYGELPTDSRGNVGDIRRAVRGAIGVEEFSRVILRAKNHPDFVKLGKHLALMTKRPQVSVIQNAPSSRTDEETNKLFELLIGAASLPCGGSLQMDEPSKSSAGKNPDVLITIHDRRWGFACKALHSLHHEAVIENIRKGIDQIEKSPAEAGVVVLSMKNVLVHDRYWPISNPQQFSDGAEPEYGILRNADLPITFLQHEMDSFVMDVEMKVPSGFMKSLFASKKALPGYALWGHVAAGVLLDGKPTPMSARVMKWHDLGGAPSSATAAIDCIRAALMKRDPRAV